MGAGNKVRSMNQVSIVTPFGFTGALAAHTYREKFRTFSILNNSGTCSVTMPNGNVMNLPVGVTVNWDTEVFDAGSIIEQRAIHLFKDDTLEKITDKIHRVEHYVYPEVIKRLIDNENK